jgi:phosphoribosylformylglycinamidine synthase
MPHPEAYIDFTHHPRWTRGDARGEGAGLQIFRNGVRYAAEQLLNPTRAQSVR